MIEKILNKYFAKKCVGYLEKDIKDNMFIDTLILKDKRGYSIYIKKPEYKDYTKLYCIKYENSLREITEYLSLWEFICKEISEYMEKKY